MLYACFRYTIIFLFGDLLQDATFYLRYSIIIMTLCLYLDKLMYTFIELSTRAGFSDAIRLYFFNLSLYYKSLSK